MRLRDILEGRISAPSANDAFSEIMGEDAYNTSVRGFIDAVRAKEALSPSDFPILFADTLDRILLGAYKETPVTYKSLFKMSTVPDFRDVKRFYVTGGDGRLDPVLPDGEYPMTDRGEGLYTYHVSKYGKRFAIDWEAFVNDDLNALKDQPERFGRGARRSEEHFATGLYAANATVYTVAHGNKGTAALAIPALQNAITAMRTQLDGGGDPIFILPRYLVVPPQLEATARNILNAQTLWWMHNASTTVPSVPTPMPTGNWMPASLELVVVDYLPILDTTNGATGWYLFGAPADGAAFEFGHLAGHETPELFMKSPDALRISGGTASPFDGSYNNDSIDYKIRHVFGGTALDYRYTYFSDGTA